MKLKQLSIATALLVTGCIAQEKEKTMTGLYDIKVTSISGESIPLSAYKVRVLVVVKSASKCGFTGQYEGLQKLYETYEKQGLVVLGFPSNDFMKQEPGSNEEIASFCKMNYGVTFPLFEKITVKGDDRHPLYRYLTAEESNPDYSGKISWNFNKFIISRDGKVIGRFGSRTKPDDKKLVAAIDGALKQ